MKRAKSKLKAPVGIGPAARAWWSAVARDYAIGDSGGEMLLSVAAHALDELQRAEAELRKHGLTIVDRFGQRRAHPAAAIARDSRSGFLQAVKALGLELPSESPRTEE